MLTIHNVNTKAQSRGAYSRILVPSFHGCRCPNEWLRGSHAEKTAQRLMDAADRAGLGVQGEAKITLFGETREEQMISGPTIEFVLRASGFAMDFWPEGRLTLKNKEVVLGAGHGNLHYCNRDQCFNKEAMRFLRIVRDEILFAEYVRLPFPKDQPVDLELH